MNECEKAALLGAYHDGELSPDDRVRLERHLGQCHACAAELERITGMSRMLGSLPNPELSPAAVDRLHATVDRLSSVGLCRVAEVLAAAAAIVLMVCVIGLSRQHSASAGTGPMPVWESQAISQPSDGSGATEELLANWMVQDLSGRDQRD